jgi:hypothetical protein
MPHLRQKMGDSTFTMKVLPLGQGGMPLGQQNWGTQRPQQNYCHQAMGDAAFAPKNGGLNIHNESIAAWAKGDAAWATNLGDSMSTTKKLLPPGNGGCHVCAKKWGTQCPHQKVLPLGQRGGHAQATKKGEAHILQRTNILTNGPWHHLAVNTRTQCLVHQRSLGSSNLAREMFLGHGQSV